MGPHPETFQFFSPEHRDIQYNPISSPHLRKPPKRHPKAHLKALFLHFPIQLPMVTQGILALKYIPRPTPTPRAGSWGKKEPIYKEGRSSGC